MPGVHTSAAKKFMRVRSVRRSLLEHRPSAAIVAAGMREWGVSARAVQRYIVEAREQIRAEVAAERPELLALALASLDDLYAHLYMAGDFRGCLAVQAETNKLLGLYPRKRRQPPASAAKPVQRQQVDLSVLSEAELREWLRLSEKVEAAAGDS